MPSFQISDPSARVALTPQVETGKTIGRATIPFVVENLTGVNRTAHVRIVPAGGADPALFSIADASPTSPSQRTIDFAPRQAATVNVTVAAPCGETPSLAGFHLRVTLESDPDNDSVDSRPVVFDIPAAGAQPKPPAESFPWWAVIAAAVILIVAAGGATWLLWPKASGLPRFANIEELVAYFKERQSETYVTLKVAVDLNECNPKHRISEITRDPVALTVEPMKAYVGTVTFGVKNEPPCQNFTFDELTWHVPKTEIVWRRLGDLVREAPNIDVSDELPNF